MTMLDVTLDGCVLRARCTVCGTRWQLEARSLSVTLTDVREVVEHPCTLRVPDVGTTDPAVIEVDRNARAYGWEVGHGQPLAAVINFTDGNPFADSRWRDAIYDENRDATIENGR